jgi:molybdate transport system substrate-binding protein
MTKSSIVRIVLTALLGLICAWTLPFGPAAADAAEVKVLASVALASALDELIPVFERSSGNKVSAVYGLAADLRKRVLEGEAADVVILTAPAMDDLQKQGKLVPGSLGNVGGTEVSVAARAGAPKPDIGSVDAFKSTLLSARSIVYADPAKGGASGVYFARVLDRLRLAEQLKAKTILVPGAQAAEVVAKGEAELGIAQASEIVPVSGAQLVGPLPGEFASTTIFAAGVGSGCQSPESAKGFIQFLKGQAAAPILKAMGFVPR